MNKFAYPLILALVIATGVFATPARANVIYNANFSAPATGGSSFHYYFFVGHSASQTFASGLSSVDHLDLTLNPTHASNTQPLGFTFYLNGFDIGQTTFAPGDFSPDILDFDFASVTDALGNYTLLMSVTAPVCGGCGSVAFSTQNALSLSQSSSVPEPMTLALLGAGLLGIGVSRKRT